LPHEFPHFVRHLRRVLCRSPRTILRQAIELVDSEILNQELLQKIRSMLQLHPDANLYTVGKTVDGLSKGRLYHRLEATRQRYDKHPCNDKEELNKIVCHEMSRKRSIYDSSIDMEKLVNQIRMNQYQRRDKMQNQLQRWEHELDSDPEYRRYCLAKRLWKECGGEHIWNNCKAVEAAICHNRNVRGDKFESKACEYAFTLIVKQISNEIDDEIENYSYIRGAHWWCDEKDVGEIDMVIYHQRRGVVVAICEMKSVAFEISIASRQHDAKLDAVSKFQTEKRWKIGKSCSEATYIFGYIPLFVVTTLLPSLQNSQDHDPIGVEPLVIKAVCQGIRLQGKQIAHPSSLDLCQPLVTLLAGNEVVPVGKAIHFLENFPTCPQSPHNDDDIDYNLLRTYVLQNVGEELLNESPLDWFHRFPSQRLLVLPRNIIFNE
jgi:hypothetical protein